MSEETSVSPRMAFSQEWADSICDWVAQGKSLVSFCKLDATPGYRTVMRWLSEQPTFTAAYRTAHQHQADYLAEEVLDIADKAKIEGADVARLRIDARKWYAAKLAPKKYGDKIELGGVVGLSKAPTELSDEELLAIAQGRNLALPKPE